MSKSHLLVPCLLLVIVVIAILLFTVTGKRRFVFMAGAMETGSFSSDFNSSIKVCYIHVHMHNTLFGSSVIAGHGLSSVTAGIGVWLDGVGQAGTYGTAERMNGRTRLHRCRQDVPINNGHIALYGDPAPAATKGHSSPIFGPYLLWPNCWMDQDATW